MIRLFRHTRRVASHPLAGRALSLSLSLSTKRGAVLLAPAPPPSTLPGALYEPPRLRDARGARPASLRGNAPRPVARARHGKAPLPSCAASQRFETPLARSPP